MAICNVGHERWWLLDAGGVQLRIENDSQTAVRFPVRWRVFGPWGPQTTAVTSRGPPAARPLFDAAIDGLTSIPDVLVLGEVTCGGQDVELEDDLLDLAALFGTHDGRPGHQAYAMAYVEVEADSTLRFGAGSDYFMQWWIDGRKVLDTLLGGNRTMTPARTDYCVHHQLAAGRHVIVARVLRGAAGGPAALRCYHRRPDVDPG